MNRHGDQCDDPKRQLEADADHHQDPDPPPYLGCPRIEVMGRR